MWFNAIVLSLMYTASCQGLGIGVISSPQRIFDSSKLSSVVLAPTSTDVRIRSTRKEDIEYVSSLLSEEQDSAAASGGFNWKASINSMRRASSFQTLLLHRHQTIIEGHKALSKVQEMTADESISEAGLLRLLWDQESFRCQLQKAAELSTEEHIWKDHNFALCPPEASHLQHVMLTAEIQGTIVGFCEVAMLQSPDDDDCAAIPTIVNLVTDKQYRRRGIASGLLESAIRYVKKHWINANELALHVDRQNQGAVALYRKQGFETQCSMDNDKLFMLLKAKVCAAV